MAASSTNLELPTGSTPVFRFDDGWVWARVLGQKGAFDNIRWFELFDAHGNPILTQCVHDGLHGSISSGVALKARCISSEVFYKTCRSYILPFCTKIMSMTNLHLWVLPNLYSDPAAKYLTPIPAPDVWFENAKRLEPEFKRLTSRRDVNGIQPITHEEAARLTEQIFTDALVTHTEPHYIWVQAAPNMGVSQLGCPVSLDISVFHDRISITHQGKDPWLLWAGHAPQTSRTSASLAFTRGGAKPWFTTLEEALRNLFVPCSEMDAWIEAHSAPGEVLIDFEPFDLLGVLHPVVDIDERYLSWAQLHLSGASS